MPAVNGVQGQHHINGATNAMVEPPSLAPIAIVGLAGRFPGEATTARKLWDMCCQGRSAWSEIPANRFNAAAYFHPNPSKSGCVRVDIFLHLDGADSWSSSIPEELIL